MLLGLCDSPVNRIRSEFGAKAGATTRKELDLPSLRSNSRYCHGTVTNAGYDSESVSSRRAEEFQLLVLTRGLIPTNEMQQRRHEARLTACIGEMKATTGSILPEFSKFDGLPGQARRTFRM